MVGQGEQFAHLRHAKAEFARAPHKSERRQMFVRVIAVIAIGSVGSWKDALALVIADGFRLGAGCPSQFADTPCLTRSEERRVGNECGSTCRSRGSPYP